MNNLHLLNLEWKLSKKIRTNIFINSTLQNNNWCRNILGEHTSVSRIQKLVYSDVCGPTTFETWGKHKYFGTFLDISFTLFVFIYCRHKSVKYLRNSKNSLSLLYDKCVAYEIKVAHERPSITCFATIKNVNRKNLKKIPYTNNSHK